MMSDFPFVREFTNSLPFITFSFSRTLELNVAENVVAGASALPAVFFSETQGDYGIRVLSVEAS